MSVLYKSVELKRACDVIKSDRMGASSSIENLVNREITITLNEFFSLCSNAQTVVSATESGFDITIKAKAKSVKQFKIIG